MRKEKGAARPLFCRPGNPRGQIRDASAEGMTRVYFVPSIAAPAMMPVWPKIIATTG